MLDTRADDTADLVDELLLVPIALVVLEDQLQDVVQIDLLALQQVDLEGDLIPVQLALLLLLRLTTMADPVTYIIVGRG